MAFAVAKAGEWDSRVRSAEIVAMVREELGPVRALCRAGAVHGLTLPLCGRPGKDRVRVIRRR